MEDFIKEIYRYADIVTETRKMAEWSKAGCWRRLSDKWESMREDIASFCRDITGQNPELGKHIWNEYVKAGSALSVRNSCVTGDILEKLLPFLYEGMSYYGGIDVVEGDYRIFSSESGFLSIEDTSNSSYLTGCIDPAWDAYLKATTIYYPNMRYYFSLGCEMGYLPWQLFEVSRKSLDIYIYEFDVNLSDFARLYGVLDRIPSSRLHLFKDKDQNKVVDMMKEELSSGKYSDTNTYVNIEASSYKKLDARWLGFADEFRIADSTKREYNSAVEMNYYRNRHNVSAFIHHLKDLEKRTDWIVVGAGPSVDDNMEYLSEVSDDKVIVATMTIYRKLVENNVRVDYLTVIDPNEQTYKHIEDVEIHDARLILTDCADWQYGEYYKGEKYLIPTEGYYFSDELYRSMGIQPWDPLGTVTSMSIELSAYLGAERIELIGADLAYPTGTSHAQGTAQNKKVDIEGMIQVEAVDGGVVYTDQRLDYYRHEIEELIVNHKNIRFYNRSRNGAYIKGCINV